MHTYARDHIKKEGYYPHSSRNKLRDVDDQFYIDGHLFDFNKEILGIPYHFANI